MHAADVMRDFDGECWTCIPQGSGVRQRHQAATERYRLRSVESHTRPGLSLQPDAIHEGQNSGYQALNLAVMFGATRVLLLGYDMQKTGGRSHFFGDHPGALNKHSAYENFARQFDTIADQPHGIEIINCTRQTALNCFVRQPLEQALGIADARAA